MNLHFQWSDCSHWSMTKVWTAFKVAQFIPTPSRKKEMSSRYSLGTWIVEIFSGHLNLMKGETIYLLPSCNSSRNFVISVNVLVNWNQDIYANMQKFDQFFICIKCLDSVQLVIYKCKWWLLEYILWVVGNGWYEDIEWDVRRCWQGWYSELYEDLVGCTKICSVRCQIYSVRRYMYI